MSEMIERVAHSLLVSQYGDEVLAYWPDRLASFVSGPPFEADEYREMARAAIEAMRAPTETMLVAPDIAGYSWRNDDPVTPDEIRDTWQQMIDAALCTANKPT